MTKITDKAQEKVLQKKLRIFHKSIERINKQTFGFFFKFFFELFTNLTNYFILYIVLFSFLKIFGIIYEHRYINMAVIWHRWNTNNNQNFQEHKSTDMAVMQHVYRRQYTIFLRFSWTTHRQASVISILHCRALATIGQIICLLRQLHRKISDTVLLHLQLDGLLFLVQIQWNQLVPYVTMPPEFICIVLSSHALNVPIMAQFEAITCNLEKQKLHQIIKTLSRKFVASDQPSDG